ncbi:MAG: M16 family metallopeptidase [Isosphaeraceae bacterium]
MLVLGCLVAAFAAPLAVAAPGRSAGPEKVTSVEGITEYKLDDGLRVLLFPDATRPKVTVNLTVLVGSRHEGYGETGMAHLLEHMLFKGTPTHPNIPAAMKEHGAEFNGSTWLDRTNYYETLPASDANLEYAIRLEADRMINSPIRAEDLASEFSVVRNEFESGENSPRRVLSQRMMAVAYEWHNYGKSTIGNRTDIERVPADSLRAFYKQYYQPDNAVLVVAGRFDEKKALEYIQRYFGPIPRPERKLRATYTEEPAQDGERYVTLRRVGSFALVGVDYHIPAGPHPDFAAIQILGQILDAEPSGRLYKALVETHKAANVGVSAEALHDPGTLDIMASVETKERATLDSVRDVIYSVIDGVAHSGVTQEEVDRARRSILKGRELALLDPNEIAIELSEWAAQGDWRLFFLHRDRIEKVTREQVKEVAAKYLTPNNRTVGYFLPTTKPERTPIPETPELASLLRDYKGRQAESSAGEQFDVSPEAIEARVQRPEPIGGVKVALLPKKTRGRSVELRLTLHYGNAENLKGFREAAQFLPELMTRGTRSMSRQQIQDELDKNLADLGAGSGGRMGGASAGGITFTIETKRPNLVAVLEILRQILREPTLPESEFEVLRRESLAGIEQGRTEPQVLGINRLQRALAPYPADDVRYVPTIDERLERVKALKLDQIRRLYADYLGADHGELAIVGDFEPSEVLPILARTLDGWKSRKPYARIENPIPPGLTPVHDTIETPDKANAVYFAGLLAPVQDTDPDYPALMAGNSVLGGSGLSSRLADRLRQKDGLSYGAASMFSANSIDRRASLMIMAIYNPKNRDKVMRGVQEELDRLLREGVAPAELARARAGLLKQQAVTRSNDGELASMLASELYLGRTMQFEAELERKLAALSADTVNAALRKVVDPKQLSIVTAGDFQKKQEQKK